MTSSRFRSILMTASPHVVRAASHGTLGNSTRYRYVATVTTDHFHCLRYHQPPAISLNRLISTSQSKASSTTLRNEKTSKTNDDETKKSKSKSKSRSTKSKVGGPSSVSSTKQKKAHEKSQERQASRRIKPKNERISNNSIVVNSKSSGSENRNVGPKRNLLKGGGAREIMRPMEAQVKEQQKPTKEVFSFSFDHLGTHWTMPSVPAAQHSAVIALIGGRPRPRQEQSKPHRHVENISTTKKTIPVTSPAVIKQANDQESLIPQTDEMVATNVVEQDTRVVRNEDTPILVEEATKVVRDDATSSVNEIATKAVRSNAPTVAEEEITKVVATGTPAESIKPIPRNRSSVKKPSPNGKDLLSATSKDSKLNKPQKESDMDISQDSSTLKLSIIESTIQSTKEKLEMVSESLSPSTTKKAWWQSPKAKSVTNATNTTKKQEYGDSIVPQTAENNIKNDTKSGVDPSSDRNKVNSADVLRLNETNSQRKPQFEQQAKTSISPFSQFVAKTLESTKSIDSISENGMEYDEPDVKRVGIDKGRPFQDMQLNELLFSALETPDNTPNDIQKEVEAEKLKPESKSSTGSIPSKKVKEGQSQNIKDIITPEPTPLDATSSEGSQDSKGSTSMVTNDAKQEAYSTIDTHQVPSAPSFDPITKTDTVNKKVEASAWWKKIKVPF